MMQQHLNETISHHNNEDIRIVLCTTPDEATAKIIAKQLVVKKLAACVTLLPQAISFYRWQDELEQQTEVQMLIKTHITLQDKVFSHIKTHHPYQVPELLVIAVTDGDINYLAWLKKSLN
ncbi:divalent cation tolerance protein CutA [Arsenophonus apicola]|jgi:periplasmic divalent cation tolerance protein|uniref:divalent cation tolerance protein CutA n=1 Tax=Arsenophonus apicola TaxID=2879119 RepID=UPI0038790B26